MEDCGRLLNFLYLFLSLFLSFFHSLSLSLFLSIFVHLRAISTIPDRSVPALYRETKKIIVADCFQKELMDPSEPADISAKLSIYSSPDNVRTRMIYSYER